MPLLYCLCFLFCMAAAPSISGAEQRPNFIVIVTDDQQWAALSVVQKELGSQGRYPWVKTPNMDRIANEGIRFRNGFVTLSLCSPSRAAILTGQYNHLNGVSDNHTAFPSANVTFSALMRDAGYQTAYFGKFHHGKQPGPRPGYEINKTFIDQGVYFDCPFEIDGTYQPTKGWVDDVTTDFAIDFLRQPRDRPFSIFIGFKTPHEPTLPPERAKNLYSDELGGIVPNLTVLPIFRASETDLQRKANAEIAIHNGTGVPLHLNYFRCISAADDAIGRLLQTLDETRLAENTVLVFMSDNGCYAGEHCLNDKRSAYEDSLRIPLLVRYPKGFPKGKVIDQIALNIDVAPTLLDLAGIPVPSTMQGRSWRPLITGETSQWRKSFLGEYFIEKDYPNTPTLVCLRTETAKLVSYPGHEDWTELFDLQSDPFEIRNLSKDPAHADLLAQMRAEFEKESKAVGYCIPSYADKAEFNPNSEMEGIRRENRMKAKQK